MKKLEEYKNKRNFNITKEPSGEEKLKKIKKTASKTEKSAKMTGIFAVQHHYARREHYDFRLEWRGVLISFAVPKGPSYNPKDKRLAIHVEDHPIDYADFEGVIPKGEYGGGTVMLWDIGEFKALQNIDKGLKDGSIKVELFGQRLKGKWALVKLKDGDDNWLLLKDKDEYALKTDGISSYSTSIKSGRTIEQIAGNLQNIKNPFQDVDLKLCTLKSSVPNGKNYVYEIKYDGYRIVAFCEANKVNIYTRNKIDYTKKFLGIAEALNQLAGGRAMVLDGEIVALDEKGKPNFQALQAQLKSGKENNVVYMVFDLLALDGKDLRTLPLVERKNELEKLLKNAPSQIAYVEHFVGSGNKFFKAVKNLDLEGVVAKDKTSTYTGTRDENWIKVKARKEQEFVVCGFKAEKKDLSAILLGYHCNGKLIFVGKCGTGFNQKESKALLQEFEKIKTSKCPFEEKPKEEAIWLKPKLVAQIQFAEITKDGVLRQASFKGLRQDKSAKEVILEGGDFLKNIEKPQKNQKKSKKNIKNSEKIEKSNANSKNKATEDFYGIKLTHPEKLLFKEEKIRKIDVLNYYNQVADEMLKFMKGRLLSVVRCHGSFVHSFYKKHPTVENEGIKKFAIQNDEGKQQEYFSVEDKTGLLWQVQLGTLEFHMWGSHAEKLDKPDYMVFDLDPDKNLGLDKIRQGVRDLKKILDSLSLKSFLKTSGGKGYHIVVPFSPSVSWQTFHDFSEKVAHLMENKWPERYTTNIRKNMRKGKIFIDFMRNTKGATSVAPYSLRARPGAKVSVPIFWSELNKIEPNGIDMFQALKRLKTKNPWADFFETKQSLKKLK